MMLRRILLGFVALFLVAACSGRPGPEVLTPVPDVVAGTKVIRIYAVTTRTADENPLLGFDNTPSFELAYRYYDISVPPHRRAGQVTWPSRAPDPSKQFVVVDSGIMERPDFLNEVIARNKSSGTGEVGIFVHGFNQRYQEALFRLAQLTADAGGSNAPILFAWPSNGRPLEYIGDRQAAIFSREPLAELMDDIVKRNGKTLIFAHSMGGFLTMEAMRTLKLEGKQSTLDKLSVVLAAPDVDLFLFRRQMEIIGEMREPLSVLVSPDDRALLLSSRVGGGRPRLGALDVNDPEVAAVARDFNIRIIDVSSVETDPLRHSRYINLATLYTALEGRASGRTDLATAGTFVFDAIGQGLLLPVNVLTRN